MRGCLLDLHSFDRQDIRTDGLLNQLDEWDCHPSSQHDEVAERIQNCDVVITNKVRLDRKAVLGSNALKLVLIAATGTDNVDLEACRERGVMVCNTRGYSRPAVVQHTLALMLNLRTRQMDYQKAVRRGDWCRSPVFCLLDYPIHELEGSILGIVGYGDIGRQVAHIGRAFGMQVAIATRPGTEPEEGRLALTDLLTVADVVSLHCPLTDQTRHLISTSELRHMKSSALLINTSRGGIIHIPALIKALRKGEIAGAGIDVLDQEPPSPDHPLLDSTVPNLIVTPHNAWGTRESRQRLVDQMEQTLIAWRAGSPRNVVA